jgi:hypothetical protein
MFKFTMTSPVFFVSSEDFLKMADLVVTVARRKRNNPNMQDKADTASDNLDLSEKNPGKIIFLY